MPDKSKYSIGRILSLLLAVSFLAATFAVFPIPAYAAEADYTFSEGAVLLDSSYNGKNILIQNGVFSVTVSGAAGVNIIFDSVTIDRRYATDTANNSQISGLYSVATSLGWGSGTTYYAQTCPLLVTNNASVTVAFRGENNFYAGTNRCRVYSNNTYSSAKNGGGFAGIQVDAGSVLTIAQSGGTINAHGAFYVDGDNSENSSYGYSAPDGTTHNALSGGAGIGGGVAWNTTTSDSSSYAAGTPGTIIINGGNVNAFGGHQAAGIGGGLNGAATASSITINGGNVCAYGGRWAAGIGDGDSLLENWTEKCANSYAIIINGGTVSSVGGVACPGIGTTDELSSLSRSGTSGMEIHLNGGTVVAKAGYPDGFNPGGTSGYSKSDAAAAIGAGNKTNMESNSISISSSASVIASGFGHYSITENGTRHDEQPKINIDSSGYMLLGRFPELASRESRIFDLFEAQRYDAEIGGRIYQYIKYVTQPSDGSTGEIYYYCPEAPDHRWLMKAGTDGTLENATLVSIDSVESLKSEMERLLLTLWVDEESIKIDEVAAPAFFRSIAISLPNPNEHGGIYALRLPVGSLYGYTGTAVLPKSGYAVITIDAQKQGTISGELAYPSIFNIEFDSVSETLIDLDIYRDGLHTDGRDGLIGDAFMENVFAYKVYIEHDDNFAYIYARYSKEDDVTTVFESLDGLNLTLTDTVDEWIAVGTVDMTGIATKTIRLKKTDTVKIDGQMFTPSSVIYKITIVKKVLYKVELDTLDKVYDGVCVNPSISRLYSDETGGEYIPTEDEKSSVSYIFSKANGTLWIDLGANPPKDAGIYRVTATVTADTYTATSETVFVITKRNLTVSRIQNSLVYVSSAEHAGWSAPREISDAGMLYLSGVVGSDDVLATAKNVFYNDISIGYGTDKITLTGIILSGSDSGNYDTADTQTVFGQISYSLDGAIFRRKPGANSTWDKFYPVDSQLPVNADTADYHSPANDGVYDTHGEYVYARTENKGDEQSVYAVDIEFGSMYFTYSRAQWNTDDMVYEELVGQSRWTGYDGTNNRIGIINRSNFEICYAAKSKIDFIHSSIGDSTIGIKANFYPENSSDTAPITGIEQTVPAATAGDSKKTGTAGKANCYLILSGVPQLGDSEHFTVIGNVTVTVSRYG
mgnify:CR=1 FL=1